MIEQECSTTLETRLEYLEARLAEVASIESDISNLRFLYHSDELSSALTSLYRVRLEIETEIKKCNIRRRG